MKGNKKKFRSICLTLFASVFMLSSFFCSFKDVSAEVSYDPITELEVTVGYWGMTDYTKEIISLSDLKSKCKVSKEIYTWIDNRPSAGTTEARGIYLDDLFEYFDINRSYVHSYHFYTLDASGYSFSWKSYPESTLFSGYTLKNSFLSIIDDYDAKVDEYEQMQAEYEENVADLEAEKQQYQSQIDGYKKEITGCEAEIAKIEEQLKPPAKEEESEEPDENEGSEENEGVQDAGSEETASVMSLRSVVNTADLESQKQQYQAQIDEYKRLIAECETKIDEIEQEEQMYAVDYDSAIEYYISCYEADDIYTLKNFYNCAEVRDQASYSDKAWSTKKAAKPMLALSTRTVRWTDTYALPTFLDFDSSYMSSSNAPVLYFGMTSKNARQHAEHAHMVSKIHVYYEGAPTIETEEEISGEVGETIELEEIIKVETPDEFLTGAILNNLTLDISDGSVLKQNEDGSLTFVGEGEASINVMYNNKSYGTIGTVSGKGTGDGDGLGNGDGEGVGTGDGDGSGDSGTGSGGGVGENAGDGDSGSSGDGSGESEQQDDNKETAIVLGEGGTSGESGSTGATATGGGIKVFEYMESSPLEEIEVEEPMKWIFGFMAIMGCLGVVFRLITFRKQKTETVEEEDFEAQKAKYTLKRPAPEFNIVIPKQVKILIVVAVIAFVAIGGRVAFGPAVLRADISAYAEEQILITGLTEEDFYVTPAELAELDLEKLTTSGTTEKSSNVQAIGPTLDTFLEAYGEGTQVTDIAKIKFYGSDGYNVVLVDTVQTHELILSVANGKEALYEEQWPLRIVIPGEDPSTWIRLITKIEFTLN